MIYLLTRLKKPAIIKIKEKKTEFHSIVFYFCTKEQYFSIMQTHKEEKLNPIKDLYIYIQNLVQRKLWLRVLVAIFLGIGLGSYLATTPSWLTEDEKTGLINWIALPGNLFIRIVQMIMVPLMFSSVIQGIAGGNNKDYLLKSGAKVLLYFGFTSIVTLILAVTIAGILNPGDYMHIPIDEQITHVPTNGGETMVSFSNLPEILTNLIPNNPLESLVAGDMLSIVVFALIIGVSLVNLPEETSLPLLKVLYSVQEVTMAITKWTMKIAPLAVFGLMVQVTSQVGIETIFGLSMFIVTVISGLILTVLFYFAILRFYAGVSIGKFMSDAKDALLLGFSISSSAAVMPLTLKTAEEKMKINPSVSRFVIPIGVSLNMDGTAVFQAIATLFLAQVYGLELDAMSITVVIVTTIMASIGTPSAPGAGVIVLGSVLSSIGIPITAIALIIGVDRLLGMFRTAVNVMGDLVACQVFNKIEERKSEKLSIVNG